jgi:hypothetical protein
LAVVAIVVVAASLAAGATWALTRSSSDTDTAVETGSSSTDQSSPDPTTATSEEPLPPSVPATTDTTPADRSNEAISFLKDAVARHCDSITLGATPSVVEPLDTDRYLVDDGSGTVLTVDLGARTIYGTEGPDGVLPYMYGFCDETVFVGYWVPDDLGAEGSWIVVVESLDQATHTYADAQARADALVEDDLNGQVLDSTSFPSLNPGYWVVYVGHWETEEMAAEFCRAHRSRIPSCYPRVTEAAG